MDTFPKTRPLPPSGACRGLHRRKAAVAGFLCLCLSLGLAVTGSLFPARQAHAGTGIPVLKSGKDLKVVELFTSEGCSSCPPAEARFKDVVDEPDVLALAYHVDYWDYIGWPDPFAKHQFTVRQRQYANDLQRRTVYTPQMVFQGSFDAPGSRPGELGRELSRIRKLERIAVGLTYPSPGRIDLTLPRTPDVSKAAILLVAYDRKRTSKVLRGENAGKTLTHRNVVRSIRTVGTWNGQGKTMHLTVPEGELSPATGCAVLIQALDSGRILGAAAFDMPG